jgi:UDP-glucose:(heptosyl)LPS alpha-1,3-glucosyltransferase
MRIALVLRHLDPARGGAEQWTCQMALRLLQAGHEVTHVGQSQTAELGRTGIRFEAVQGRGTLEFADACARHLAQRDFDVVADMGSGWFGDVVLPHGGSKTASFEQNLLLLPAALRPIKRGLARLLPRYRAFADLERRQLDTSSGKLAIALSQMTRGHFTRFNRVPAEQIRVVYNGVNVERFTPHNRDQWRERIRSEWQIAPNEKLLLIVAHNFALKGVDWLIRAMGRLVQQQWPVKLAVVGRGATGRYSRLARQNGCGEQVRFIGPMDDSSPAYAAADVYVQPTFYDPCSLVVLEALACGLPTITSRFNGAGELIRHGEQGFVIDDPTNVADLADCIARTLNDSVCERMGRAARELALQHTLDHNYRDLLAVFTEAAARKQGHARKHAA